MPEPDTTPAAEVVPCRTTRHCAIHGFCRRCSPARAQLASAVNIAIQRNTTAEGDWGPLYTAVMAAIPDGATAGTTGRTETRATIANPQAQGGNPGDSGRGHLRDQLCEAFIQLIRDHADRSIIAPGYMADAALAVRDQEMQALRDELAEEAGVIRALRRQRDTAEATLSRVQAELDRITALPTVTADDGHADRFSVGARWTLNLIRAVLNPPAPGGQTEGAQS